MLSPEQLTQFGLNTKEAKIYLASLELGPETVQNIAKKASIHRVSAYDILEKLIKDGLAGQITHGNKRKFFAVEPKKFLDKLNEKKERFKNLLPELSAVQAKSGNRPKVMYFEGKDEVWEAFLDRIRYKNVKENLVYGSSEKLLTIYPEGYKNFIREKVSKGIKAKIIVEKSKWGELEKSRGEKELREVKFWPAGTTFKANTIIYEDRVMIVSWENMLAVIIEDKNNADNQRILFDLLWKYLP